MQKIKIFLPVFILIAALFISGFTLLKPRSAGSYNPNPIPQKEEYRKEWKTVDSLISAGLPKSALERSEKIYQASKADHNDPQMIKAILYRIKLNADFEEDFMVKMIADLNADIKNSETPARQVLQSIQADLYRRYYQANRYRFMNRTVVESFNQKDIATWDLKKIMQEIVDNYQASLDNPYALKKIRIRTFEAILDTNEKSPEYRPTLYDFLAHRAVDFFMNDESSLIQPANRFELDKPEYFTDPETFCNLELKTQDSLSLKFYALGILQDLIRFHLKDKDPAALVDVNLERLEFVHQNAILTAKDSLFLDALQGFEKSEITDPSSTRISHAIARHLNTTGQQYNPLISQDHHWEIKQAAQKCKDAIRRFPDSDGAKNCRILLAQIKRTELQVTTETVVLPGKPAPALLDYRNTERINYRLIKMDYDEDAALQKNNRDRNELIKKYLALKPSKTWQVSIPDQGDFQSHSTEFKIPALDLGYYILLASADTAFNAETGQIAYSSFWSSNISYLTEKTGQNRYRVYVLDRETGMPMKDVKADLYYQTYNYKTREYENEAGGSFISDENGYFEIPALEGNARPNSFYLVFTYKNDKLVTNDRFYRTSYSEPRQNKTTSTYFFTDRAIYRPGQTIFFKGIVLEKLRDKYEIKPGSKTTVVFNDVNYQKISELNLTTNEYGSFSGSFTAPTGTLTGNMIIRNETGSVTIHVEEYKRPTFEVVFNPVEGSYKLDEKVSIEGQAKAYAGSLISGSEVKYRVVREVRFPWRIFNFDFVPYLSKMEITNGTSTTDDNGKFTIDFIAIPDYNTPKKFKPVFSYTVYADVTDITGETQSSSTVVNIGYSALQIDLKVEDVELISDFNKIGFKIKNLNGRPVKSEGTITISKLNEPDQLFREQYWHRTDIHIIPEKEFKKDFPNDPYRGENEPDSMKVGKTMLSKTFNSAVDSVLTIENPSQWEPGRYVISVNAKDKFGTDVERKKYFILADAGSKKIPVNEIGWFHALTENCEPGGNARFIVGTGDKNVKILYEVVRDSDILKDDWITLNDQQKLIEFPVTENLRGGYSINFYFVKHNRSTAKNFHVDVPYTNKKLDFEFITFRDKLEPGQKEQWKIRIKGKKGDKVAAELLASMYDASLDALTPLDWHFDLYRKFYGNLTWNSGNSFKSKNANSNNPVKPGIPKPVILQYDQLNWFGFSYYGGNVYFRGGKTEYDMALKEQAMPGQALEETTHDVDHTSTTSAIKENFGEPEKLTKSEETAFQLRRDFRETAFFYPDLHTDENGDVLISFDMPESLTRWKLMGLAHTKDLKYGSFEKEIVTQKELMVVPNPPRFFRQGDTIVFSAKVVNMSNASLEGKADLEFFNTMTGKEITNDVLHSNKNVSFKVEKGGSEGLAWNLLIPDGLSVISYRISAKSGNFSDGEEKPVPVLTNRMLVTESLPLPVKGNETKKFRFEKLLNSTKAEESTLQNFKLTLEFASNPAWYAVQALPYIMEQNNESADNAFNRFYANSIASFVAGSNPRIKQVFDAWKNFSPDALLSNLEKNEELKSVILKETPWVLEAQSETEQKHRIALLFDLNHMSAQKESALRKLSRMQSPGGGWPWYKGMPDNRYISQQIVLGFGHLKKLGVFDSMKDENTKQMLIRAVRYLDQEMQDEYERIRKQNKDEMNEDHLSQLAAHYLLARSYFMKDLPLSKSNEEAFGYFRDQAVKYWNKREIYTKAMLALALNNLGVKSAPSQIMASLKEYALYSDEMGMYFRDNTYGYYWYEAPIETQALLIEAFDEIMDDQKSVEQMKIWLLKQKQTQAWETSKATAEAVYALLLRGGEWLASDRLAVIKVGKESIDPLKREDTKVEAGTGYFKTSWSNGDIKPEMGEITVTNENPTIAWGVVYWQYFEDLDKIIPHETPLLLKKQLFVERNTPSWPVIEPVTEETTLNVGDRIKVRIELHVDRDMEFVHMKDMRASAFEPVNVLSGYRYQGGLGYYESTLDASTNFFFDYLRKGTFVFEYPLVASQKGNFSNGITTIQCMYAPVFTSHSEGVRVMVE